MSFNMQNLQRWFLVLVLCYSSALSRAQVTPLALRFNDQLVGPSTLFELTISNTGGPEQVAFSGGVWVASGEEVLRFSAKPFPVPAGTSRVSSALLDMESFAYSSTNMGRYTAIQHRLTGGEYRFCVEVAPLSGESSDELCEDISVDDLLFMEPIWPMDNDVIEEQRPNFSWTVSGAALPPGQSAQLVLVPCKEGLAARCIGAERPLFIAQDVRTPSVPFPPAVPSLEPGARYAWQVERSLNGVVVDRTDPWLFSVHKPNVPAENKYVNLTTIQPGSVYEALGERIFFRYDEAYSGTKLSCLIFDEHGQRMEAQTASESDGATDVKGTGINLYETDLQPYHLKKGYYRLVVADEKNRSYSLKFHIEP
jgi:hypothetical protein